MAYGPICRKTVSLTGGLGRRDEGRRETIGRRQLRPDTSVEGCQFSRIETAEDVAAEIRSTAWLDDHDCRRLRGFTIARKRVVRDPHGGVRPHGESGAGIVVDIA
jgi:hypothetical protein